jgi:hypothetical protein
VKIIFVRSLGHKLDIQVLFSSAHPICAFSYDICAEKKGPFAPQSCTRLRPFQIVEQTYNKLFRRVFRFVVYGVLCPFQQYFSFIVVAYIRVVMTAAKVNFMECKIVYFSRFSSTAVSISAGFRLVLWLSYSISNYFYPPQRQGLYGNIFQDYHDVTSH